MTSRPSFSWRYNYLKGTKCLGHRAVDLNTEHNVIYFDKN